MSKKIDILSPDQFRAHFPHAVPGAIKMNRKQWDQAQEAKPAGIVSAPTASATAAPAPRKQNGAPRQRAAMNKTEKAFFELLKVRVIGGEFDRVDREGISLRWPDGMVYSPDFIGWKPDGKIVAWEVKGPYVQRHGLEKWRAARAYWQWIEFEMHQLTNDGWRRLL